MLNMHVLTRSTHLLRRVTPRPDLSENNRDSAQREFRTTESSTL